ncbi:MAG: hypothetical protein U0936_01460 [Planctomycetaceae bacterium]
MFSINGDGVVRRCHFVEECLGNDGDSEWVFPVTKLVSFNQTCGLRQATFTCLQLLQSQIGGRDFWNAYLPIMFR